jgi:pilus assembly protein Flp/PilA
MSQAPKPVRRLGKDEDGASLIEYTVLLGILLIAVIVTIGAVGNWINSKWTALNKNLTALDSGVRIASSEARIFSIACGSNITAKSGPLA